MQLPELHLNTTGFLCIDRVGDDGSTHRVPSATAFFVTDRTESPPNPIWAVTAGHCIEEARATGENFFLRVNTKDAYIDIPTKVDDWHLSHEADVAAVLWLGPPECPITAVPLDQFIDSSYRYQGASDLPIASVIAQAGGQRVMVGHEVSFVGLFSQHAGMLRNLPIARFGAVSRLPAEPIQVERPGGRIQEVEGYLVESQSWGGHSGSPAFWYWPVANVRFVPDPRPQEGDRAARRRAGQYGPRPDIPISMEAGFLALLGLVSAHFDIPTEAQTHGDVLGRVTTRLNSGIAVVTPAHFIRRLVKSEPVMEELQERGRGSLPQGGIATQDVVSGDG